MPKLRSIYRIGYLDFIFENTVVGGGRLELSRHQSFHNCGFSGLQETQNGCGCYWGGTFFWQCMENHGFPLFFTSVKIFARILLASIATIRNRIPSSNKWNNLDDERQSHTGGYMLLFYERPVRKRVVGARNAMIGY